VEKYFADDSFFPELVVGQRPARTPVETITFYGSPRTTEQIVRMSRELVPVERAHVARAHPPRQRPVGVADSDPVGPGVAPTLLDPELQQKLADEGYVVMDALSPEDVAFLRQGVDALFAGERRGFHASNTSNDPPYRRAVHELLAPVLQAALTPRFAGYDVVNSLAILKFAGEDSGFVVHQDWKMVDENRYRGVNVWCPLVDTDADNGGLLVLPGSHRLLNSVRCGPDFPSWYDAPGLSVSWADMVPVEVRAGQALVFDHRLLHSSAINRSDDVRPVAVAVMLPSDAQAYHWFRPEPDSDELDVLAVDNDFFFDFEVGDQAGRPQYPVVDRVPFVPDEITTAELVERCRPARTVSAPAVSAPAGVAVRPVRRSGRLGRLGRFVGRS
jgi:hypothetical protein